VTTAHSFGQARKPGEFVFVPRPQGQSEDDGWMVGMACNLSTQKGELHILDARDMTAAPLAVVHLSA
jgi:carotenoid cleavage dioxygenase-like enzyme